MVNDSFKFGEEGIWKKGHKRINYEELYDQIHKDQLVLAYPTEYIPPSARKNIYGVLHSHAELINMVKLYQKPIGCIYYNTGYDIPNKICEFGMLCVKQDYH